VVEAQEPEIIWQYFPPIRAHQVLDAKTISNPSPGVYVYDFGQNLAGVARVRAKGAAGTDVKLRFAEVLNPDGSLTWKTCEPPRLPIILCSAGVELVKSSNQNLPFMDFATWN